MAVCPQKPKEYRESELIVQSQPRPVTSGLRLIRGLEVKARRIPGFMVDECPGVRATEGNEARSGDNGLRKRIWRCKVKLGVEVSRG